MNVDLGKNVAADVNNTGGEFASGINDTGGQFATCVVDANSNCKYLREFSKKFQKETNCPLHISFGSKLKQGSFLTFQKSLLSGEENTR
jgi:hypothetical protein